MASEEQDVEFFKAKLYTNFRDTGLVDNLKAQLRFKLVDKLQKKDTLNKENIPRNLENGSYQPKKALLHRLIVSLISEFMQKNDCNYSNAVFLPEAGFTNQILIRSEMVDILKVNRLLDVRDLSFLEASSNGMALRGRKGRSLLDVMIDYVWSLLEGRDLKVNAGCQTDFDGSNLNLEQKLRKVEYEYHSKFEDDRSEKNLVFDEKFLRLKREYEARMKTELEAEIARIRDFEIAALKIEEAEKYRLKMEQYREELEKMYLDKVNKLRERERDTIERCKQQIKNLEAASYEHRQKVLKDLEIQKLKEKDWEGHQGFEHERLKSQQEKIHSLEKDFVRQKKEMELEKAHLKLTLEKSKDDARKELLKELDQDRINIYQMKATLEADAVKIEQYKAASESFKSQNERLLQENGQLVEEITSYRNGRKDADSEITRLRETIETLRKDLKREEDYLRKYESQVQFSTKENEQLRAGLDEYSKLLEQKKHEIVELNQRHIKDIEHYQHEIEKVDKDKEELRRQLLEIQNIHVSKADFGGQKDITRSVILPQQREENISNVLSLLQRERELERERENERLLRSQQKHQPQHLSSSHGTGDDPASRFQALKRELDDLKRKREEDFVSTYYQPEETRRILTKTEHHRHHSPKFKHEYDHRDHRDHRPRDPSPQLDISTENLENLHARQRALRAEFLSDDVLGVGSKQYNKVSPIVPRTKLEESKRVDVSDDKFDAMFDKYSDKLLEETPLQKRLDEFGGGSTFEHKTEVSNVRNLFKGEPQKASSSIGVQRSQESNFFENIGESNRQTGNQPQPFMFKNKKEEDSKPTTRIGGTQVAENKFAKNTGKTALASNASNEDEFEVVEDDDKLYDF